MEGGVLRILREGRHAKFVRQPQQICFHGPSAVARGQQVLYVTERAVFELTAAGLELRELAPGIRLEEHVLPRMEFNPVVGPFRSMDAGCFSNP
jgi:propionate CoA-transferase